MYCTRCGVQIEEGDLYCRRCGKATKPELEQPGYSGRRLTRAVSEKKLGGVCAGFARYWDVDVTLMRLIWIALAVITGGLFVIVYILAWIIMPREPQLPAVRTEPEPRTSAP